MWAVNFLWDTTLLGKMEGWLTKDFDRQKYSWEYVPTGSREQTEMRSTTSYAGMVGVG